jgi:hypothetical protein
VEAAYDISIPDETLALDIFATPGSLWAVIRQLGGGRPHTVAE